MKNTGLYFSYLALILVFTLEGLIIKGNLDSFFFNRYYEPSAFDYQAKIKPFELEVETEEEPTFFLDVNSAIAFSYSENQEFLFEKNPDMSFPIASLTKLMTAWVVLEHPEYYKLSQAANISDEALSRNGGKDLEEGQKVILNDLLHAMLIESSNDSAYAIAENFNVKEDLTPEKRVSSFISLMNLEAKKLSLKNTVFFSCTGLEWTGTNRSSSRDLVKLAKAIIAKHPEIFEISKKPYYPISNDKGEMLFTAYNRNELLGKIDFLLGGKTGWTPRAGGCILLVQEKEDGYLISVVLGANSPEERFTEIKKLLEYIN
jgi:D-alanyl-D-alanine carboxypeptidase (penicillin-binding protein 5/6)